MILIVMGLPGNGKTEVAKYLERKLNGLRINTDELYKHLYPDKKYINGDFPPGRLDQVYNAIGVLAFYLETSNPKKFFILEGSFRFQAQREHILNQFKNKSVVKLVLVEVKNEKAIEKRISERHTKGAPDTYNDYLKVKDVYERPTESDFSVDNSDTLEGLHNQLDNIIETLKSTKPLKS